MNIKIPYLDYQQDFFFNWPKGVKYKLCRKGRRAGITRGAAHAIIEWLIEGDAPILWGETTHGNIIRYFERYFEPLLKENGISYTWDKQDKKLDINGSFCDFRSADNPDNWEGFGYRKIFLNEAGIILKNKYLYVNSVLPMLLDFPDSKLIAAGVPKGKILKDGSVHPFYSLFKRGEEERHPQYQTKALTSYDNPLLSHDDIRELENEIAELSPEQIRQEIYGEFIEMDAMNPFAHQYKAEKHESTRAIFNPARQIVISIDFNINPFAVTFSHIWRDVQGYHDHQFDEMEIRNGSIPEMITRVQSKYGRWLQSARLTGDAMGNKREIADRELASLYKQLLRGWQMSDYQLNVTSNPSHVNSREDCNFVLLHMDEFLINPETCPLTCRDFKIVQCDAFGQIRKKDRNDLSQRADFLDTVRYKIHNYHKDFIKYFQNLQKNNLHLQS